MIEVVHIKRVNAGSLRAFVAVNIHEVIIKDFRVVQQEGQAPWVSVPQVEYTRNGERRFKPLIQLPVDLKKEVSQLVLKAYRDGDVDGADLPY